MCCECAPYRICSTLSVFKSISTLLCIDALRLLRCRVLHDSAGCCSIVQGGVVWYKMVQGVAGCCRVLQWRRKGCEVAARSLLNQLSLRLQHTATTHWHCNLPNVSPGLQHIATHGATPYNTLQQRHTGTATYTT